MCQRELSLARQEAEGSSRSGQALSAELHTLGRQNAALQQQLASVQAQLEETLDGRQAEVGLVGLTHSISEPTHRGSSIILPHNAVLLLDSPSAEHEQTHTACMNALLRQGFVSNCPQG